MTPVFHRLTKAQRIEALDIGTVILRRIAQLRELAEGELPATMMSGNELNRAADILFQMSVELESGMRR